MTEGRKDHIKKDYMTEGRKAEGRKEYMKKGSAIYEGRNIWRKAYMKEGMHKVGKEGIYEGGK